MKKYTTGSSLIKKQYESAKKQLLSNGFKLSEYGEIVHNISAYAVYKNVKLGQEIELSYYWVKRAGGYVAGGVFDVEFV
jgi:hypothetical protein